MYKLDLHTHSVASYDGVITEKQYEEIIAKRILDVVAITDHNKIDFAQRLHKKLGNSIIVGEEIRAREGEVIGLFLEEEVSAGMKVRDTIKAIHVQGGLVYIPHPLDILRSGVGEKVLLQERNSIDIIEGFNGRMILRWKNTKALDFAKQYNLVSGVGSDAHNAYGLGNSYAVVEGSVSRENLRNKLKSATLSKKYQPIWGYLGPSWNKLCHSE